MSSYPHNSTESPTKNKAAKLKAFTFSDRLLPSDFVPTKEEQCLLDTYSAIRLFEKEAAKFREAQAKAKLTAADERYRFEKEKKEHPPIDNTTTEAPKKHSKKRKDARPEKKESSSETEEDRVFVTAEKKPIEKPSVEETATEEAMRGELLGEVSLLKTDNMAPLIKKKPKKEGPDLSTMLLSSVEPTATPPYDFSKNLGMYKDGLDGIILFPPSPKSVADSLQPVVTNWSPPTDATYHSDRCLEIGLPNFDSSKLNNNNVGRTNNTLAIKLNAPSESKRFSFNITSSLHDEYNDVLVHFNPRQREKGGILVINDKKESVWGAAVTLPLSQLPKIFGQTAVTIIMQINSDGFDFFVEGEHCARLVHRTKLPTGACSLNLQFPSTDDYGNFENLIVYRVWWGYKESMIKGEGDAVAGSENFDSVHPKKLFVQGLPKLTTEAEAIIRRAELERAFVKYGGKLGAIVTAPLNCTFAFVELESQSQAEQALLEQSSNYRISKARRSRFEALQEQREAMKQAKGGPDEEWE
mmetsp:Transcript_5944/g.8731  ORF Transcript_5944/g.8731 Transcript_5944/m.8731 type:complete len:526 (-) Transcript_5944:83-1660(-)|eukprot:CAMPEP_0172426144 /NCGR_PEP_ID=MMETSP1064-20121228/36061_1 /TAXON_ID=202472 /ORGANISM="Aulacoseira subarctica , Strain CCAP 1002/5" /LENGTH=525 /DNA_ID=CAMNT_0013169563 /DNA_START=37 /DNA_END=1614 /DNA_ORIENTATION=-